MYVFRQKEYSLKMTQAIAKVGRALGSGNIQSKRKALKLEKKILSPIAKGKTAIEKGTKAVNQAALNPGATVNNNIIAPSIETPLTATALKAVPVPGASALVKPLGKPEKALWKKVGVNKKLEKTAKSYPSSKVGRTVESGINGIVKGIQSSI